MTHEIVRPSESSLDGKIKGFLNSTQFKVDKLWQQEDFCANFPKVVKRLLSPEGLERFPASDRNKIFSSCLTSFTNLPWTKKPKEHRSGGYIRAKDFYFTVEGKVTRAKLEATSEVDSLARAEIASIILLGMSLPEEKRAMGEIITFYKGLDEGKQSTSRQSLGLLLIRDNISRQWLKNNQLDKVTGYDWDTQITELIFNFPGNVISERKKSASLPSVMTGDLKFYSSQAIDLFLYYAFLYAQSLKLNEARADEIKRLMDQVKELPSDYVHREFTQGVLLQLTRLIDPESVIQTSNVERLIAEFKKSPPKFRWLVKED